MVSRSMWTTSKRPPRYRPVVERGDFGLWWPKVYVGKKQVWIGAVGYESDIDAMVEAASHARMLNSTKPLTPKVEDA